MENNNSGSIISREKIDQMAIWVGSTVSSAFFSSLERFSCVNVSTADPDNDDDNNNNPPSTATATANTAAVQVNGHNTNDVANLPV